MHTNTELYRLVRVWFYKSCSKACFQQRVFNVFLRPTSIRVWRLEMGSLPTALQSAVQDRRDVWNEANNANGPSRPEVQAL